MQDQREQARQQVFAESARQARLLSEAMKAKEPRKNYEVVTFVNDEVVSRLEIDDPFITTTIGPVLTGRTFVHAIINRLRACLDCLRGKLVYKVRVRATNQETTRAVMYLAHVCNLCEVPRLWRGEFARERLIKHQWAIHAEQMVRPAQSRFLAEVKAAQSADAQTTERTVPKAQLDELLRYAEKVVPLADDELERLKAHVARQTPMTEDERDEERRVAAEFAARLKRREEDSK